MVSPSGVKHRLFYGWVIVAAFLIIGTLAWGVNSSFGVFLKPMASDFGLSRVAISGVRSVQAVIGSLMSIIGGWALDRFGPRVVILLFGTFIGLGLLLTSQTNAAWQLFITYSLLLSVIGAVYITIMGTVSRWFDKKRGLALGIAGAGSGLGAVVMAPFAAYLISGYGWRMAYIVMGLIVWLVVISLSRIPRRDPHEIGALPDGVKSSPKETSPEEPTIESRTHTAGLSLQEALKTRKFWFFGYIWLFNAFSYFLVLTHIVPYTTDFGIPSMQAAIILSLIGGSSIAGRLLMGRLSDIIGRKKIATICALFMAMAMMWLLWPKDLLMLYIFGVVFGFFNGGLDPIIAALVTDTFGVRRIGSVMGALQAAWGIGIATGPAVGGLVFDVTNSYSIAFMIGGLGMLTVALLIALTRR